MLPPPDLPPAGRFLAGLCLMATLLFSGGCSSDDGGGDRDVAGPDRASASETPSEAASGSASETAGEPSKVDSLLALGLQQIQDESYEQAEATFQQVLDLEPDNTYATYDLGYLAQVQGDEGTAIERYTTTLTHDKDFAPALYNLAILTESSDLHAAVVLYRRDIAVKPDDAPAYMRLGFALRHLGHDEEGRQLLQKGVQLDPAMADVSAPSYP